MWACTSAQQTPGCPNTAPNLGTPCAGEGVTCAYRCDDPTRVCRGGIWVGQMGFGCPRSSRLAKREIRYLDNPELQRIRDEVLRTRLATWEYRDAALAGKRHLGFIIEDQPRSLAVDRSGTMVDLYDYTSMLLAATQVQAQQIAHLELELAALKKRFQRRR